MKRGSVFGPFCLVLTLAVAALAQPPDAPPVLVKTAPVVERSMNENEGFIGVIYFDRISSVSPETEGLVTEADFRAGQRVKQGDVLVRLNADFLEKDMALAKARIEQADVILQKTRKNMDRYQELYRKQAASEVSYDDLKFDYQTRIKELEVLKRELAKIELTLAKTVVRAPFDGIVLEKSVERGDWISPGKALCRVGCASEIFAQVPVSEKLVRFVEPGQKTDVLITAYDEKIEGTIAGILPVADEKTKNVSIKVRLGELTGRAAAVAENMSVTVYLPTSEARTLRVIPRDALVSMQGKDFVYTIQEGKAALIPIHVVAFLGSDMGVDDSHVTAGMPVVVDGNGIAYLQPGRAVRTSNEPSDNPTKN